MTPSSHKSSGPSDPGPGAPRRRATSADAFRYAGLGMTFAVTMGLFGLGGFFLDGRLGTSPLFLIVAVFAGFGLGLYSMVSKLPASGRKPAASAGDEATQRQTRDRTRDPNL